MTPRLPKRLSFAALLLSFTGCRGLAPDTEIGRAASTGGIAVLESLLKNGADANLFDSDGIAPLHIAARLGRTEAIRTLVKAGALLLEKGADPRAETSFGLTALWGALGGGGLADITDGPGLGVCFPDTVRALLARAPDLRLNNNLATTAARFLARSESCRESYALVEPRQRS